jgi:CheY-like chemotaxis protein
VKDNERVVRDSFLIRYENERLLDALAREREEVLLARDRAEEADRAKSRFLAAASHDLRQPLHALSLFSAALSVRASDDATRELSSHMDTTLSALSLLLDSLLDISKLDAGAVQPEIKRVSVGPLMTRIAVDFRAIAQQKGLDVRVAPVDADVQTDPALLERILRNLVDNAVKYTRRGVIELAAERDDAAVRVSVRDTGPGIPPAERERIFEEFYQIGNPERDRAKGLGLGLAIVRRLARLLRAEIELKSDVGQGSTFIVSLPPAAAVPTLAVERPDAEEATTGTLSDMHVLVIDDEPAVRIGMRALLESWGCRVMTCSHYAEAERLLDEYGSPVDMIIADFRLREHENGIETVHRLRARVGEVPALLLTGDTAPERLREAKLSGLPLLHKPVTADKLRLAMIAELQH